MSVACGGCNRSTTNQPSSKSLHSYIFLCITYLWSFLLFSSFDFSIWKSWSGETFVVPPFSSFMVYSADALSRFDIFVKHLSGIAVQNNKHITAITIQFSSLDSASSERPSQQSCLILIEDFLVHSILILLHLCLYKWVSVDLLSRV